MNTNNLSSTMEDYLESILELEKAHAHARVKDIAQKMNVKLPTVTSMIQTLKKRGLVNHEKYEYVRLSPKGRKIAQDVYRRHSILKKFLTDILHIDAKSADEDACRIEHAVSPHTLERILGFTEFIETCPRGGADWLANFDEFFVHGYSVEKCKKRMKDFEVEYKHKVENGKNK